MVQLGMHVSKDFFENYVCSSDWSAANMKTLIMFAKI